jgi:hypothetical protein
MERLLYYGAVVNKHQGDPQGVNTGAERLSRQETSLKTLKFADVS